jgi:hypothetical protein
MAVPEFHTLRGLRLQVRMLVELNEQAGDGIIGQHSCFIFLTLIDGVRGALRTAARTRNEVSFQDAMLTFNVLVEHAVRAILLCPNPSETAELFSAVAAVLSEVEKKLLPRFSRREAVHNQFFDMKRRCRKALFQIKTPPDT